MTRTQKLLRGSWWGVPVGVVTALLGYSGTDWQWWAIAGLGLFCFTAGSWGRTDV